MTLPSAAVSKPRSFRLDAEVVIATLHAAGHIAYLAGGCVRDQLLGLEPKDFDVATDAPPPRIRQLFAHTQAVGAAFGVVLVHIGRSVIEVATFRKDGRYEDGRHPSSVTFATPPEDAQRRDFTMNGLFFDVTANRVIDFVDGEADLRARTLRAIGKAEDRFAEDHLRLLRAVRFAARFDLTIEPKTADALQASVDRLPMISPERIAEELRMMLAPATRLRAFELLEKFGLLAVIFRFAPSSSEIVRRSPLPLGDAAAPLPLALAAAAWQRVENPAVFAAPRRVSAEAQALRKALRWSNDEGECFSQILQAAGSTLYDNHLTIAGARRMLGTVSALWIVRMLEAIQSENKKHAKQIDELLRLAEKPLPTPFLSGEDLMMLGLRPGPLFKKLLDSVYDAQLEDRIDNRIAALDFAKQRAASAVE